MKKLSVGPKPVPRHPDIQHWCTGGNCPECKGWADDKRALAVYHLRRGVIGVLVEAGLVECDDLGEDE